MAISRRCRLAVLVLPLVSLSMSGCGDGSSDGGSRITSQNFEAIHASMTGHDLVRLLGEPTDKRVKLPALDAYWTWVEGDKIIEVMVEPNGMVRAQGRHVIKRAENLD